MGNRELSFLHNIRETFSIPDLYCLDCDVTLKTEDSYKEHVRFFPHHKITHT